jgi:hypothetical protein
METPHTSSAPRSFLLSPETGGRLQFIALVIGVVALAIAGVVALMMPRTLNQFFHSYLMAYLFWTGLALGCLGLLMVQYVARGAWGVIIRRVLEAGTRTLPLMAILFVPIIFGIHSLYEWSHENVNAIIRLKQPYLNTPFFLARAGIYFLVWLGLMFLLNRWSTRQDETGDYSYGQMSRNLSGPALVIFALVMTFASVDWIMSLDAEWYSTIFGILFMVGGALSAMAFVIIVLVSLSEREPLKGVLSAMHFHDLGKFLLAFVMLFAYMSLSQFLIIWMANLPEEIPWYLRRMRGEWQYFSFGLVMIHFAIPFMFLLSRNLKRRPRTLMRVAILVFVARLVYDFWTIAPEVEERTVPHFTPFHFHFLDILLPIGIGGIWLAVFLWQLRSRPILPVHDSLLERALTHGHGHHH